MNWRSYPRRIRTSLMAGLNLFASFLQQATAQGTRSTILTPLAWFFATCVAGLLGSSVRFNSPFWIQVLLGCFASLSGFLYLGAYAFCILTRREGLLRTEKFSLQQLAIEKYRGDSSTGVLVDQSQHLPDDEKARNQPE